MLTVTGSPLLPWVAAIEAVLAGDTVLATLVPGGIYAALPAAGSVLEPYVVLGDRDLDGTDGGAMQIAGGLATLTIDVWSDASSSGEAHGILSRIFALLERQPLEVVGYSLVRGSMTRTKEALIRDFDPDMPERTLFHGSQDWTAWVEETL